MWPRWKDLVPLLLWIPECLVPLLRRDLLYRVGSLIYLENKVIKLQVPKERSHLIGLVLQTLKKQDGPITFKGVNSLVWANEKIERAKKAHPGFIKLILSLLSLLFSLFSYRKIPPWDAVTHNTSPKTMNIQVQTSSSLSSQSLSLNFSQPILNIHEPWPFKR